MKTKQTLRLSLVTAAVLVVLLCLIAVLTLNVSPFAAKAETTIAGPLTVPDGYVAGQYEGWQYEGLTYSELEARLQNPATSGRYFSIADDYQGTVTVSNVDKPSAGACSAYTPITPNVNQAYTVTLSWTSYGDYEGGMQAFNIMIDKCHIKASAFNSSSTHVYGNQPYFAPAFTPKLTDTVELSKWYYQADGETRINDFESKIYDAGSYKMEVVINGGQTGDYHDAADYYVLDQSWYDYTITPRPITPAFKWNNMLVNNTAIIGYTGSNIALTKTNTDGIAGVSFTVEQWQYNNTEYVEDEDVMAVGMYKVVSADVALVTGDDAPQGFNINNYCLDGGFNSFTFNIGKRALELTWDAEATFRYNGSAQVRQATYTVKIDPNFNDQELVSSDALPELQITGDETDIGNNHTAIASLSIDDAANFDLYVSGSNVGSSTTASFSIIKGNVGVNITQKNGAHLYYANFDVTDFDDIFEVTFTHTGENNVNFMIDTSSWKITDPQDGEWAGVTSISALYDAQTSGKNPGRQYRVSVRLSLLTQVTDQYAVAVHGVTYYSDEFGQNQVDSVEYGTTIVYGYYYYWSSDLYETNATTGEFLFDYEKAPVYARPTTASYDYDGENHLPTITYKLFDPINGQDATFCVFPTNDSECDVGTYPLTALIKEDYGYDDCYQFIVDSSFTINAVDLGGTLVQSNVLTYTGNDLTATASGLTSTAGQAITITYCDEEGGTYGDMPTFVTAGNHTVYYKATAPNHNQKSGSFTVNIGDATITGTLAQTNSLTYDGTDKTATAGGLATVDGSEITITYAITEGGSYGTMPKFTNADTYEVFYKANATYHAEKTGSFFVAVGQFEVELAWSNDDLTYDGTEQLPVATVSNKPANGEAVTVTVTGKQVDASENQYTATATALSSNNYKLPANADHKFSIGQFEVALAWSDDALIYNKTAQKPTATVSNKPANGEAVTVTVTGEQTNARAEAYTATATALSSNNYKLPAEVTHSFTISAKEITVSGLTVADRAYNKSAVATVVTTGATFAENDVEDGDTVTVMSADGAFADANAGKNKTVTISNIVLSNANYAVKAGSQTQTTATIDPKEITVNGLTVADRAYNKSAVATVITTGATFAENDVEDGDTVTVTSADGAFADANVEVDEEDETVVIAKTVTISNIVLSNANYAVKAGSQTSTTAKINPLAISLDLYVDDEVATEKVEITYDGDAHTFVVKAAGLDADVIIVSEDSLTNVQGSTEFVIPAQFLMAEDSFDYNYQLVSAFNVPDYAIVPRLVTVTGIVGVNKIYDGDEEANLSFANVKISNVVFGEELVVTSATATFANADAGQNKTISISDIILSGVEETEASNYEVKNDSQTKATATITAKTVELTWSGDQMNYVGASNEYKPNALVKASSIVEGDEVNVTAITGGVHYATTDGLATATALDNENYQLPANATCAFVVNKASLTVNIDDKSSTYGEAPKSVTYTLGSTIYDLEGDIFTVSHSVTATTNAGTYAITLVPANNQIAASYDITAPDATYTVDKAELTVAWTLVDKDNKVVDNDGSDGFSAVYYGYAYTMKANVVGLISADDSQLPTVNELFNSHISQPGNAGTNYVSNGYNASIMWEGMNAIEVNGHANYFFAGASQAWSITQRAITVTYGADNALSYTYGNAAQWEDIDELEDPYYFNLVTNDASFGIAAIYDFLNVKIVKDTNQYTASNLCIYGDSGVYVPAGTYDITAEQNNEAGSNNFVITCSNLGEKAQFIVGKGTIDISASITGWTYGQSANVPSVEGNLGNGDVTYEYKLQSAGEEAYTTDVPVNAGAYYLRATVPETDNYFGDASVFGFTIAKAAATFTAPQGNNNLTYSGEAQALISAGTTSDGTFNYKVGDGAYGTAIPTAIAADTYTVYYKVVGDSNHEDSADHFDVTINALPVVLTWSADEIVYDGEPHIVTAVVSNKIGNDEFAFVYDSDATRTNYGQYSRTVTALGNSNYTLTNGTNISHDWSIIKTPAVVMGVQGVADLVYDGEAHELVAAGAIVVGGTLKFKVDEELEFSAELPTATFAGTHIVYYFVEGDENHSNSEIASINVTIAKRLIRIKNVNTAKIAITSGESKEPGANEEYWNYEHYQLETLFTVDCFELVDGYTLAPGDELSEVIVWNVMNDPEQPWLMTGDMRFDVSVFDANYDFDINPADANDTGCDFNEFAFVTFSKNQVFAVPAAQSKVYGAADNFDPNAYTIYFWVYSWDATNNTVVREKHFASTTEKADPNDPDSLTELEMYKSYVTGGLSRVAGEDAGTYAITLGTIAFKTPAAAPVLPVEPNYTDYATPEEYLAALEAYQAELQAYSAAMAAYDWVAAYVYYNYEIVYLPEDAAVYTIVEKPATQKEDGSVEYEKTVDETTIATTGADVTSLFDNAKAGEGEVKKVVIESGKATIVFDAAAINDIAGNQNVVIKLDVKNAEAISEEDLNGKFKDAQMLINVSLANATFANGKATISIDFDKATPKGMVGKVYYVDENGNRTDMNATFADGKVSFETNHFSDYIVVFEKSGLSGGAIAGIVVACVVVVAGCAVAVFFFLKKKNGPKGTDTTTTAAEAAATASDSEAAAE